MRRKKLTQLYVASVVGVTTDTISRWENNRSPTIKRDNAEKLASALEVDLGDLLRRAEAGEDHETVPAAPSERGARRLLLPAVAALALLTLAIFFLTRHRFPALTAVRWAPHFAAPGEIIPVQSGSHSHGREEKKPVSSSGRNFPMAGDW